MIDNRRRMILKGGLSVGAISAAIGAGLLAPQALFAAWNEAAFRSKDVSSAMKAVFGDDATEESGSISIKAPPIAENGAVVPVSVETSMSGVSSISILVEQNGTPLAAKFNYTDQSVPFISTRIKMGKTSNVIAVVEAGGKRYSAKQEVKVTIGGCGG